MPKTGRKLNFRLAVSRTRLTSGREIVVEFVAESAGCQRAHRAADIRTGRRVARSFERRFGPGKLSFDLGTRALVAGHFGRR